MGWCLSGASGPALDLTTLGFVRHPVDLAQPDDTPDRGQPSTKLAADVMQVCPRSGVW